MSWLDQIFQSQARGYEPTEQPAAPAVPPATMTARQFTSLPEFTMAEMPSERDMRAYRRSAPATDFAQPMGAPVPSVASGLSQLGKSFEVAANDPYRVAAVPTPASASQQPGLTSEQARNFANLPTFDPTFGETMSSEAQARMRTAAGLDEKPRTIRVYGGGISEPRVYNLSEPGKAGERVVIGQQPTSAQVLAQAQLTKIMAEAAKALGEGRKAERVPQMERGQQLTLDYLVGAMQKREAAAQTPEQKQAVQVQNMNDLFRFLGYGKPLESYLAETARGLPTR